jgi:hypothetical protein
MNLDGQRMGDRLPNAGRYGKLPFDNAFLLSNFHNKCFANPSDDGSANLL